jgi:TP901 family phage tail tape measure protein
MSGVQFEIKVIGGNSAQTINGVVDGLEQGAKSATGFNDKLKKIGDATFVFNNISQAIGSVVSEFNAAIQPGISFNSSLTDMQAITGVNNEQLMELGGNARQLAKDFGIDAAGAVEANKLLLSQLSPEIAKNSAALDGMTRNAAILSKQLQGDTAAATEILTTAMNQYGVSLDDPMQATKAMAEMMNIMSAGAKEGSAELPQIKSALEQAGMMAKTANVSFAELNAGIQILDKSGKKGAEGGVALRNVMAKLSEGNFLPRQTLDMLKAAGIDVDTLSNKGLGLTQRLEALKPLVNDTAAMTQMFGTENVSAAIALVNNSEAIDQLTEKITGTNTATEMADTVMGSFSERMARTNAWLKDAGISLFNATEGFIPFIQMGMGGIQTVANLGGAVQAFSIISKTSMVASIRSAVVGLGTWISSVVTATAAQIGLNVAMTANPIGIVVVAIGAAIAAVGLLIKYWDDIKSAIATFAKWVWEHSPFKFLSDIVERVFPGFKAAMGTLWNWVKEKFDMLFGWIGKAWGWVKSLFGGDDEETNMAAPPQEASEAAVKDYAEKITAPSATTGSAGISFQGAANTSTPLNGFDPYAKKGKGSSKGSSEAASNVTSGGSKPTTINLTIHKLQDQTVIQTLTAEQGGKKMADKIIEMLMESLSGVNRTLSTN